MQKPKTKQNKNKNENKMEGRSCQNAVVIAMAWVVLFIWMRISALSKHQQNKRQLVTL